MYSQKTDSNKKRPIPILHRLRRPLKAFIAVTFIMFFCLSVKTKASGIDTNWVKYQDTAGITVYYEITTCDSASAVLVNFANSNSYDVKIEWYDGIYAFGHWINTTGDSSKSILLGKGNNTNADCSSTDPQMLISGKKWLSIPDYAIKDFRVSGLKITKQ